MDWRQLKNELKQGKIADLYLIYGEDYWQVQRCKQMLSALVPKEEQEYNLVTLNGSDLHLPELEEQLQVSLLGGRKLVFIENFRLLKGKSKNEEETAEPIPDSGNEEKAWLDLLSNGGNILVLCEYGSLDKRRKFTKLLLPLAKVVECPVLKRDDMLRTVQDFFTAHQLKADYGLLEYLVNLAGSQVGIAEQEVEKLSLLFSPAKAILLKDALPYLAASAEINVFELMDLITAKQGGKAMDLLSEMLRRGEDPVRLLALVRYQLRQIVRVKEWQRQKIDENQMAEALGVRPFAIKRISSGASKFRREDLYQLLAEVVEKEEAVLTGKLEKQIALEILVGSFLAKIH
ncbi:MAG: DNA polymerase III subunit delta [Negativicutes bacterium]|nr:DNA polymerase III subunit delta [Negativicutes bacterium]